MKTILLTLLCASVVFAQAKAPSGGSSSVSVTAPITGNGTAGSPIGVTGLSGTNTGDDPCAGAGVTGNLCNSGGVLALDAGVTLLNAAPLAMGQSGASTDGGFRIYYSGLGSPAAGAQLSMGAVGASEGRIWGGVGTPTTTNYALSMTNAQSDLNGVNSANMTIAGNYVMQCASTGCTSPAALNFCIGTGCFTVTGGVLTFNAGYNISFGNTTLSAAGSIAFESANHASALTTTGFKLAGSPTFNNETPTLTSFGGTGASITGTGTAFDINVGTVAPGNTGTITMPRTANAGYICHCYNKTTTSALNDIIVTSDTTTTCVIAQVVIATGGAANWSASDHLRCFAVAL